MINPSHPTTNHQPTQPTHNPHTTHTLPYTTYTITGTPSSWTRRLFLSCPFYPPATSRLPHPHPRPSTPKTTTSTPPQPKPIIMEAIIVKHDEGQLGFIRYTILVTLGDQSWSIVRRFNDFAPFQEAMSRAFPYFKGHLPPKKWFGRFHPEFLRDRKVQLQEYLDAVTALPGLPECAEGRYFFEVHIGCGEGGVNKASDVPPTLETHPSHPSTHTHPPHPSIPTRRLTGTWEETAQAAGPWRMVMQKTTRRRTNRHASQPFWTTPRTLSSIRPR